MLPSKIKYPITRGEVNLFAHGGYLTTVGKFGYVNLPPGAKG